MGESAGDGCQVRKAAAAAAAYWRAALVQAVEDDWCVYRGRLIDIRLRACPLAVKEPRLQVTWWLEMRATKQGSGWESKEGMEPYCGAL